MKRGRENEINCLMLFTEHGGRNMEQGNVGLLFKIRPLNRRVLYKCQNLEDCINGYN